jgi:hypothetical protein
MNSTSSNHELIAPLKTHINIQFEPSQPIELMIKNAVKNQKQTQACTPSLFQIAASFDDSSWPSKAKPVASPLAPHNWIFSRERLESALNTQISGYRKRHAVLQTKGRATRAAKPSGKSAADNLPMGGQLIAMANMVEEAA